MVIPSVPEFIGSGTARFRPLFKVALPEVFRIKETCIIKAKLFQFFSQKFSGF